MANRPYQEKVDQFMADYQDKFLPTLITGKGTPEAPYTNMGGPETAIPMTKEQGQLERDKLLASSIHPDTFSKVLDVISGKGTPGSPFTNLSGPEKAIPTQPAMGGPYNPQLNRPALPELFKRFAAYNPEITTPEAQQLQNVWPTEPTPFTVGGTTSGTLDQLRAAYGANYPNPETGVIPRGGNVINMTPEPTGGFEAEKPVPGGWDWKGELAKQGTYSVGPERFFSGGREVPAGTPGAVSGDQLARERIGAGGGSAIPLSAMGEAPIPTGRAPEIPGYEMPGEIRTALQGIQKILMQPSGAIYSPSGRQAYAGGYRPHQINALENFAGTLEKMAATGAGYQTKMAEIGAEKPYREAMGDYYRRMAGVHERALPGEEFAKYATGMHALSEAERPHAFPPNSAVYQGAKLLGYVPEKPEAIHPIIRDIINKSEFIDPNTGMKGGFDIRGARQKIGYIAPWLRSQGIEVPKESYKMTRPEFMAEQKAWVSRLPKKERSKYTSQYTNQLWGEYWGKD